MKKRPPDCCIRQWRSMIRQRVRAPSSRSKPSGQHGSPLHPTRCPSTTEQDRSTKMEPLTTAFSRLKAIGSTAPVCLRHLSLQQKPVPVRVLKLNGGAPRHLFGFVQKLDAVGGESIIRTPDVLASKHDGGFQFLPVGHHRFRVQHQSGLNVFRSVRSIFPGVPSVDRDNLETDLSDPDLKCRILILHINGHRGDMFYISGFHLSLFSSLPALTHVIPLILYKNDISIVSRKVFIQSIVETAAGCLEKERDVK